jgi:hypothetical protein
VRGVPMKPEDFEATTKNILSNLNDQGKISEYLTQLNEAYKTTYTTSTTIQEKQSTYEKEIQALKDTNMNLFLKINAPQESTNEESNQTQDPLTYDNLLKEMGV